MNAVAAGPQSPPALSAPRGHLAGIEWMKLVGSGGMILVHCETPWKPYGVGCVPLFMVYTVALSVRSARGADPRSFRLGRLRRMLEPFVVWSLFYGVLRTWLHTANNQPAFSWARPAMLVAGTWPHLWYLPLAAVVAVLLGIWAVRRPPGTHRWWLPALGFLVLLPLASGGILLGLPEPLPQYLLALPAVAAGVAIAGTEPGRRASLPVVGAVALLDGLGCWIAWQLGWQNLVVPYAVGLPLALLGWVLPWRAGPVQLELTRTSMGVYLVHPALILVLMHWVVPRMPGAGVATLAALTFVAACLLTMLLRRTPLRGLF
ncbi:MAG: acyltransferase [Planctomycetes bacterium]|nr:acyltransferase [Planctomycetota bacterium]